MEFNNGIRGIAEYTQSLVALPSFLVQGTRGSIVASDNTVTVKTKDPGGTEEAVCQTYQLEGKLFGDEADIYRDIALTLQEGAPFPSPSTVALEGTRVLDAVRESSESGQSVEIDPVAHS